MNKPLTWHYVHITFSDGVYGKKVFSYESSAAYTLVLQDARMLNSGTMFTGKVVKFTVLIEPSEKEIAALNAPSYAQAVVTPVAKQDSTKLREMLQEFVNYHTVPAGLTIATVKNRKEFSDFIHKTKDKEKVMVAKALALLAAPAASPVELTEDQIVKALDAVGVGIQYLPHSKKYMTRGSIDLSQIVAAVRHLSGDTAAQGGK